MNKLKSFFTGLAYFLFDPDFFRLRVTCLAVIIGVVIKLLIFAFIIWIAVKVVQFAGGIF